MRSCVCSDSLRLLHFPLSADHLLSCHPVFTPAHQLHLPRCGGQIPCALSLMRTLALLPSTTLSHTVLSTPPPPRVATAPPISLHGLHGGVLIRRSLTRHAALVALFQACLIDGVSGGTGNVPCCATEGVANNTFRVPA